MVSKAFSELFKNRSLILQLVKNDFQARNAGTILGNVWVLLSPLILLAIYSVVYLHIFKFRPMGMSQINYVLYIFSGLVPYLCISEVLNVGTASIRSNDSLLKNTSFPLVVLPIKSIFVPHIYQFVGMVIILFADFLSKGFSFHLLALPIIVLLQMMFLSGLILVLSLLNLIIKDLQNLIMYLAIVIMIASPIAYTEDMVPKSLKFVLWLNPFSYIFNLYQEVIVFNRLPKLNVILLTTAMSFSVFFFGFFVFSKVKKVITNYV